jgi:hypothetical protein
MKSRPVKRIPKADEYRTVLRLPLPFAIRLKHLLRKLNKGRHSTDTLSLNSAVQLVLQVWLDNERA